MGFGIFVLVMVSPLLLVWLILRRRGSGANYGGPNDGPARAPFAGEAHSQTASFTHPPENLGAASEYCADDGKSMRD